MMKKLDKSFIGIISAEILALVVFTLFKDPCGSACRVDGIFNPLNILQKSSEVCTLQCVETFYPAFYLLMDLFVLTLILYLILKFTVKGGKKWKNQ